MPNSLLVKLLLKNIWDFIAFLFVTYSTPTKNALPPSGVSNIEARQSQPKGVAGGISIFGNANSDLMASMKAKSGSLTKSSDNLSNGTNNSNDGGVVAPKKKSFGKGTVAPKPKAPSLPHENNKPSENRNSRNLSSGGMKNQIFSYFF